MGFGFTLPQPLNTKKNEKKKLLQLFKRGPSRKKLVMWVVGLTDNLISLVVGLNSN